MIPVIGIPILNGTHWLQRLIFSIDYPVNNVVIFNNGNKEIIEELNNLTKINHPYINNITICHLPSNLGVSAVWNLIIKSYNTSPYWVISNHDIAFTPGLLKEMYEKAQNEEIGMVHIDRGDYDLGAYACFLIKDWVIQKIGLFDENLSPAYCEDIDYILRIIRYNWDNGELIKKDWTNLPHYHGYSLSNEENYYIKGGSQTKKQNEDLTKKLNKINIINREYIKQKWGSNWEQYPQKYPMGIENIPITYTSYDLEFIRTKNI
jgi:GT2 family glycosyltransferase